MNSRQIPSINELTSEDDSASSDNIEDKTGGRNIVEDDTLEEKRQNRMLYLLNGLSEIGTGSSPLVDYAFSIALESSAISPIAPRTGSTSIEPITRRDDEGSSDSVDTAISDTRAKSAFCNDKNQGATHCLDEEKDKQEFSLEEEQLPYEDAIYPKQHLKPLIDSLHRKWLSDPRFPPVAVRLVARLGHLATSTNMSGSSFQSTTFLNVVYAIILTDYKDWHNLRKISRNLLCNSIHFAFEFMRCFYPFDKCPAEENQNPTPTTSRLGSSCSVTTPKYKSVYAQKSPNLNRTIPSVVKVKKPVLKSPSLAESALTDQLTSESNKKQRLVDELNVQNHIFAGMIDPMFHYLHILIDDLATEQEISLMYYLMIMMGQKLDTTKPTKMQELMVQIRRRIIESRPSPKSVAMLMELIELQSHKWSDCALEPQVNALYISFTSDNQFLLNRSIKENESSEEDT